MKSFWVDFRGSMEVEADSYEEAREKFYEQLPEKIVYSEIEYIECTDK